MHWQYNPFIIPLITAAVISAVLSLFAWRHRPAPGKTPFVFLMLAVTEWSLGYALQLGSVDLASKFFWAGMKYLGIVLVPVTWLSFALQYTGRGQWLTPRNLSLLAIEPLITLLLAWTNDHHGLVWISIGLDKTGSTPMLISTYGVWFWVHTAYSYMLLLLGTILLVRAFIHSFHLYRRQGTALLLAVLAPWEGNAIYLFGWNPFPNLDLTPFAFTVTGLVLAWSLYRFRLLDIVPTAHNAVIESIEDVVIVLDSQSRIVDLNPAAKRILGHKASEAIGQPATQVLPGQLDFVERYHDLPETHSEILLGEDRAQRYFDLRISSLYERHGHLSGRLVILRDLTERKQAEEALKKAHAELERQVERRTAELVTANEQLKREIEERKQAEEALQESEEAAKRLAQENEIIAEIGRIISSTLNIEEVYERFAGEVRKLIDFDRISISITGPEEDIITIAYVMGTGVTDRRLADVYPLTWSDYEEIIRTRSSLLIETENIDETTSQFPTFQPGFRSMMSVPLISKDRVIGILHLRSTKPNAYTERGLRIAERVGNQIAGAIANAQLFAERKRVEEALRESEERYRSILDNIEDGYFEVDLAGNFTFFNDSLCRGLGYSKEEMMGMNNRQYMGKETAKKVYQMFNRVYATGEPYRAYDWEIIRKDGTNRIQESSVSLVRNARGERIGFRGVARDVTEKKRAEEEMAALQEQLRQSQKMEAIGQLAGGIAHDFNNLLTVIKGYSQLSLMELQEGDALKGNIEEIQKAAERAANLTRQLLAFSRRQMMEMKVLDLNTLLGDLDKMLHRVLGEDIGLATRLADNLGRVKADAGQMEQVILNLAVNAKDAMLNGGKLTIETANVELDGAYAHAHIAVTPGRYVMLSVSDTGCGMSAEVKERIFEPFFTTKEKGRGTGLGLSTVYGIVKQSGGNIWVYSEPGQGTTFKIYLPQVEGEADTLHRRADVADLLRGKETVLLVEDEAPVRGLAVRVLRNQGYRVLESANGVEALSMAQEHAGEKIHLLLTDVVMPQMGGKELADRLKALRPEIKVVFTSGYTDEAIVRHGVLEPGTDFLQKPFSPAALAQKVREALDKV